MKEYTKLEKLYIIIKVIAERKDYLSRIETLDEEAKNDYFAESCLLKDLARLIEDNNYLEERFKEETELWKQNHELKESLKK